MLGINLSQDVYSHDDVMNMLRNNREVRYEYLVKNQNDVTIGQLESASGSIKHDSTREVMRTCSLKANRNELLDFKSIDYRVVPYFCLLSPSGWLRYPLGVFIINPESEMNNDNEIINIEGYDLAQIALSMKLESVETYLANTIYTSAISNKLGNIYSSYEIVTSADKKRNCDYEYEVGATQISVINDMLSAINYYPLYFDERGIPNAEPYVFPEERTIEMIYDSTKDSIVFDGIKKKTDIFSIPNRFIRYTDNADSDYFYSKYDVEFDIPSSIQNRGRVITDIQSVDDVASQTELNAITMRAAIAASQSVETIEFKTLNMPCHGFKTCYYLNIPEANIRGKYIETSWDMDLEQGGTMTHRCEKVVGSNA